jgi:hypothetical protein
MTTIPTTVATTAGGERCRAVERVLGDVLAAAQTRGAVRLRGRHPDGTGGPATAAAAGAARDLVEQAARAGQLTWTALLERQVHAAYAHTDPLRLRAELVRTAAVVLAWIQALDDRRAGSKGATR